VKQFSFVFFACAGIVLGSPLSSEAQSAVEDTGHGPSHQFGDQGQLAISSDAAFTIEYRSPGDVSTITLAPAVDYFVMDRFSVGGFLSWSYITSGDSDSSRFAIGPRVGYNFTLSDLVSLWPKVGFSFATTTNSTKDDADDDTSVSFTQGNDGIALNLFVPFMFHPAQHFFAGFGPFLDVDLSGDNKVTVVGGKLTLGGWVAL
jgi:hypothetical protein